MNLKQLTTSFTIVAGATAISLTSSCANNPISSILPAQLKRTPAAPNITPGVTPVANPVRDAQGVPQKDLYISPYPPHNPINTKGFYSGDVVGDPSTAKISEKTGKPILSTSKTFRIP